MSIKPKTCIATLAVIACAGISTPAMAGGPGTLSNGPAKPTHQTGKQWHHCWKTVYFKARDEGRTPGVAEAEADLTCGAFPGDGA